MSQNWEQALELRTETLEWWLSQEGRNFAYGWENVKRNGPSRLGIDRLEAAKLSRAAPFYITGEMCELLHYAQQSFPPTPLRVEDLPTTAGFALLEKPLWVLDIHKKDLPWQAFSWGLGRHEDADPETASGLHLSIYSHRDSDPEHANTGWRFSTLGLMHETGWTFDQSYDQEEFWAPGTLINADIEVPREALHAGVELMRTIHTFFVLSMQKIASPQSRMASRPIRKRAMKLWKDRPIPEVRVVTLRRSREYGDPSEEQVSSREYTHRWIVDGFWRRQWYPSEGRHKPKYIAPYVKGPKDKPLILKDTTYVWRR